MLDQQIEWAKTLRYVRLRNRAVVVAILLVVIFLVYREFDAIVSTTVVSSKLELQPINSEAERKQFQQMLVMFEQESTPLLKRADFLRWNKGEADVVNAVKKEALALFASGAYTQAIATLDKARHQVARLDKEWQLAYDKKLVLAQIAYDKEDIKSSTFYLNQALAIKPEDAGAILLQQQLAAYPRIAEWLQQLKVAKAGNNLHEQANILNDIVTADKTRVMLADELKNIKKQLSDSVFSQYIAQGLEAVDNKRLDVAVASYKKAKTIYSQRTELKVLQKKITQARQAERLEATLTKIDQSIQAGDWSTVATIAQSSKDPAVQAYRDEANDIFKLQQQANDYLSSPEKLLDIGVRQKVKNFIKENIKTTLKSPVFSEQINRLSELVEKAQVKQALHITSDGKTDIWVLGVGHVGKITEKEVVLLPGGYTLEGRCKGYHHKQIQVSLSARQTVRLVCDERIR
ncbi:hypothetical protein AB835_00440 [Candidatus Endobugula sertula]|uniref:Uncharacterized protein n=1 Tax=Candidatus Endobugula sertula TaxID=62101 RepID=A0A1D2QTV7_9GAMM|nr:hypothetical protein AB835_00440 [Candidatus Endobugula sertula]